MKGLILKDICMTWDSFKALLLMAVIFSVLGAYLNVPALYIYPAIVMSMLSISTTSMDERSKWLQFADAMPYKRRDIVLGKFIITIFGVLAIAIFQTLMNIVFALIKGAGIDAFLMAGYFFSTLGIGYFSAAVDYPLIFKFGAEKGRTYFIAVLVIIVLAASFLMTRVSVSDSAIKTAMGYAGFIEFSVGAVLLCISIGLSIFFYNGREL